MMMKKKMIWKKMIEIFCNIWMYCINFLWANTNPCEMNVGIELLKNRKRKKSIIVK